MVIEGSTCICDVLGLHLIWSAGGVIVEVGWCMGEKHGLHASDFHSVYQLCWSVIRLHQSACLGVTVVVVVGVCGWGQ